MTVMFADVESIRVLPTSPPAVQSILNSLDSQKIESLFDKGF